MTVAHADCLAELVKTDDVSKAFWFRGKIARIDKNPKLVPASTPENKSNGGTIFKLENNFARVLIEDNIVDIGKPLKIEWAFQWQVKRHFGETLK